MAYVITEPCVDELDKSCIDECPVDCIYEGARMMYIHPNECVDCAACSMVCPVDAIFSKRMSLINGWPTSMPMHSSSKESARRAAR